MDISERHRNSDCASEAGSRRVVARRATSAEHVNRILNDRSVRPFVNELAAGKIDITDLVADPANFIYEGTHGYAAFNPVIVGTYEVHSASVRAGRGVWTLAFAVACLDALFAQSLAWEVLTRIPHGHVPAITLATACGYRREFDGLHPVTFCGQKRGVGIWRLSIHDWVARSEHFARVGAWVHKRLHEEAERLGVTAPPHDDNPHHNSVVGAAIEMARNGQAVKAVYLYNRWAIAARHATVQLVSASPPVLKMDLGYMRFRGEDIGVSRDENSF